MSGLPRNVPQSTRDAAITAEADELYYTNEDVAFLHEIVAAAEEIFPALPERQRLPTNALFQAYYDLLPQVGVNADHDSRYARILFKIGGLQSQGDLYEKFEEVMARLGIEIEFSQENNEDFSDQLEQSLFDLEDDLRDDAKPRGHSVHRNSRRQRRNSESTAWDLIMQTPTKAEHRPRSLSPPSEATTKSKGVAHRHLAASLTMSKNIYPGPESHAKFPQSEHLARARLRRQDPAREQRSRSVSTHQNMRIHRTPQTSKSRHRQLKITPSMPASELNYDQAVDDETAVTSAEEGTNHDLSMALQQRPLMRPSNELLKTEALVLRQYHTSLTARRLLELWGNQAKESRNYNLALKSIAQRHDSHVLLQQALQTWKESLAQKRRVAELERFFEHLGRRADKARDQFILAKAFTHWAACALDQAEMTAVARRQIIRLRSFSAWRDITVANQSMIRRQHLNKFFGIWKDRQASVMSNDELAILIYQNNLVEKLLTTWTREHLCVQSLKLRETRATLRMLQIWKAATQDIGDNDRFAKYEDGRRLATSAWRMWARQSQKQIRHDAQAANHREVLVSHRVLREWRRETSFEPAKKAVRGADRKRILSEAFFTWLYRTRLERQATKFDRIGTLREAFTKWRYQFRYETFGHFFDSRTAFAAAAIWRQAMRLNVQEQIRDQRHRRQYFGAWVESARHAKGRTWELENYADDHNVRARQRQIVGSWRHRLQIMRDREEAAAGFHEARLSQGILTRWKDRIPHCLALYNDCHRAKFWFSARKALIQWRAATETAKRHKRKASYAKVRRMVKLNLARSTIVMWRDKTEAVSDLQGQSQEVLRNKTVIVGMIAFNQWQARAEELAEIEALCKERVLEKHLHLWHERSSAFQHLNAEARLSFHRLQQFRAFKKWNLSTLQISSHSIYAKEIRERNARRAFRRLFTYWHQYTIQRRPTISAKTSSDVHQYGFGATARAESWSDNEEQLDVDDSMRDLPESRNVSVKYRKKKPPPPQTLQPGYLATPSKRMERVSAAAARFGSTTPRAPLSTPAARLLRAQWSEGGERSSMVSLRQRGGPLGRSILGGELKDILDPNSGGQEEDGW